MSLGFKIYSFFHGKSIGNDTFGNTFFVDKKNKSKRWVIYANGFGPSSIPTNYHNWLHGTSDILPFFDTDKELTQSIVKQRVEKHINKKNKISSGYKAWKPK